MSGAAKASARHRFPAAILQGTLPYRRLDNWHGPLEALRHWSVILIAGAGSILAWRTLPLFLSVPAYAVAVLLIGGRQRGLSGLLHQASHHIFMANRRANVVVAALVGGYPVLQSFSGYVASHVGKHHGHFGSVADPDFAFFRDAGLYGQGRGRVSLRRYVASIFGPLSTLRYVAFLLRHRIWTANDDRRETLARLLFYTLAVAAIWYASALDILLLYWIVPLVTAQVWIGSLAELLEHYPLMEREPIDPVHMSRNRDFGRLWHFLLGEDRGEGYHLVHHLLPQIPIWNLSRVHRVLCADPAYAALPFAVTPFQALRSVEAELAATTLDGRTP